MRVRTARTTVSSDMPAHMRGRRASSRPAPSAASASRILPQPGSQSRAGVLALGHPLSMLLDSLAEVLDGVVQALADVHVGLPTQQPPRLADIRLARLWIAFDALRLLVNLARRILG